MIEPGGTKPHNPERDRCTFCREVLGMQKPRGPCPVLAADPLDLAGGVYQLSQGQARYAMRPAPCQIEEKERQRHEAERRLRQLEEAEK